MIGRAAVLAISCSAGVAPAGADPTSEALVRDFVAWVDSSPRLVRLGERGPLGGRRHDCRGLVFSRDDPRVSISIEELRLGTSRRATAAASTRPRSR